MRILVADDEAASAQSLADLLTLIGHQVVGPACDGEEAVRLAERERPDLAIFDVEMPHMSGLEAIDQITRARPIPVIVLTGHDCPEFVDRAAQLPVFNYLSKPAGVERLVPAIRLASARFLEWSALHGQVSALSQKMDERKLVERAKGILMELRGVSEDEAYRLLQRESQNRGRGMAQVARTVIATRGVVRRVVRPPAEPAA
ncbi:MAG: ANTAR domain-containing response regulator [Longimicrobiaceae bacterium]